jgi:hypothetical protein
VTETDRGANKGPTRGQHASPESPAMGQVHARGVSRPPYSLSPRLGSHEQPGEDGGRGYGLRFRNPGPGDWNETRRDSLMGLAGAIDMLKSADATLGLDRVELRALFDAARSKPRDYGPTGCSSRAP